MEKSESVCLEFFTAKYGNVHIAERANSSKDPLLLRLNVTDTFQVFIFFQETIHA